MSWMGHVGASAPKILIVLAMAILSRERTEAGFPVGEMAASYFIAAISIGGRNSTV